MWTVLFLIAGYLAGSVPFGLLIANAAGAGDVRKIGSGNIGATNVLRTGRKGLALATLLADLAKGALPTLVGLSFGLWPGLAAGLGAALGHCFPVWLRFKGGKGVATAAGVILALSPLTFVVALAVFALTVWLSRFVSLGSILAAGAAPLAALALGEPLTAGMFAILAALVVFQHRANIGRLISGTENKLGASKT